MINILFGALFQTFKKEGFVSRIRTMMLFSTDPDHDKIVMQCVDKLCKFDKDSAMNIRDILYTMWYEDLLNEDIIIKWYNHPIPKLPPKLNSLLRKKSKEFIDWLLADEDDV